jgi:PEGA domain
VADSAGLLSRCTGNSGTEGSNPSLSASTEDLRGVVTERGNRTLLPLLWLACAGCAAQRTLTVQSVPPGATLRIDDRIVGPTPYTEQFSDYGTRRITLYKPGYHSLSQVVVLSSPWYASFPIDIFSEILFPVGWKDPHVVKLELEAVKGELTMPDLSPVLDRAEALRLAGPDGPSKLPSRTSIRPAVRPSDPEPVKP